MMNTATTLLVGCALMAGAGCQSSSSARIYAPARVASSAQIMIPLDQLHHYRAGHGRCVNAAETERVSAPLEVSAVQTSPVVSAVQFNRYADPARPHELMHEGHMVYRREVGPRWRLRPVSRDAQILIGPQQTDGRGEIQPLASQELDGYLKQQRENLGQQQQLLTKMAEGMRQLALQQQQLAEELGKLKAPDGRGSADRKDTDVSPGAVPSGAETRGDAERGVEVGNSAQPHHPN